MISLLLPLAAFASDGEELLYNADLSSFSDAAGTPEGWALSAYISGDNAVVCDAGVDEVFGSYVSLTSLVANDARLVQRVEVEPDSVYRLSAFIRTFEASGKLGASLSIDNFDLDGSYCYSEPVSGTEDWHEVDVYVLSGAEQTAFNVALRLGGYSMEASGRADFASVSLVKTEEPEDSPVIDLVHETGLAYYTLSQSQPVSETAESGEKAFLGILFVSVLFLAAFAWVYWRCVRFEHFRIDLSEPESLGIAAVLFFAFALRLILSLIFYGHSTDINCFMAWGNAMMNGPAAFYTSGMFADYPPGYMYVLWLVTAVARLLGLSYGTPAYAMLFKLPATVADMIMAKIVYDRARKNGLQESYSLLIAGLIALNPAGAYISGAWGQIDSILALGLVLSINLLLDEKRILSGAVYGLTILLKPQALMLGPILAVAFIADIPGEGGGKRLRDTVFAVAAAFAAILIPSVPFWNGQPWNWLIEKYASTTSSYAYASIEAFNFPALLGANWHPVTEKVLGISYRIWGTGFMAAAVIASSAIYIKTRKKHASALWLCSAMMLTVIFTFGHYMHERYLFPVLFLLAMAYLAERDRRVLSVFLWFTVSILLNALAAMYIVDHQQLRGDFYNAVIRIGSLMTTLGCIRLIHVTISGLLKNDIPALAIEKANFRKTPNKEDGPILPLGKTDRSLHWTKTDTILLGTLILVYGVVALFGLGSLSAPESGWKSETPGEIVTVSFDRSVEISEVRVFSDIADPSINSSGKLIVSDGNNELAYTQTYDNMFRWERLDTELCGDSLSIELYSGRVSVLEIAFFDAEGGLVTPASVSDGGEALFDEQDTVPADSSSYTGMYFDELYHARTAYEHLHDLKPYENSHPPLGKLIIMLGIALFGMTPFGWRIAGTVIGILMLPVLYRIGKRVLKRSDYAFVLSALFAFDFMHFTQTRIATIDVYAVFFILLMYEYMLEYISMNFFTDGLGATLKPLGICGVFFGLGCASKWICAYAGAGLAVLFFGSLIQRYREYRKIKEKGTKEERKLAADFKKNVILTVLFCVLFYIIIPFLIYFAAYTPYYIYEAGVNETYGLKDMFRTFFSYQDFMYSYHSNLTATHPYQSSWWQWPFTMKPMWYYFGTMSDGKLSTLTASGNPAVWWIGTIGAIGLLFGRLSGRVKKDPALSMLFVGVLANFLPWVLVTRCTFIYHFFATVPFVLTAAVYGLKELEEKYPSLSPIKWIWLGLGIVMFVLLYPGISGFPVDPAWAAIIKHLPGGVLMYGA